MSWLNQGLEDEVALWMRMIQTRLPGSLNRSAWNDCSPCELMFGDAYENHFMFVYYFQEMGSQEQLHGRDTRACKTRTAPRGIGRPFSCWTSLGLIALLSPFVVLRWIFQK